MHDDTVDRTTNGSGFVKDFTFEEIRCALVTLWYSPVISYFPFRKLDAAYFYPALRGTGVQVPTFDECIQATANDEKLVYMLDIKDIRLVPHLVPVRSLFSYIIHSVMILAYEEVWD